MARPPVRVVLANDHPIIVEGLRAMLRPHADRVTVVGTALGEPDIDMVVVAEPEADVLLIDAFSRRAGGLDAAAKALAGDPPFAVAVFTDAEDPRLTLQALRIGVRGYLLKSASPSDLVDMLVRLRDGEVVVDPRLATSAALLASRTLDIGGWPGAHLGLTRREAEVLRLLADGMTLQQVARRLGLSVETVRTHGRSIYRKLGVSDRAAAVAAAWREGVAG
ncbi:MAG TPA: response regulator transcription factor [Acidimicrobiales bacterium]